VIGGLSTKVIEAEAARQQAEAALTESQLLVDTRELDVWNQTLMQALKHLTGSAGTPAPTPCASHALEAAADTLRTEVSALEYAYLQYLDNEQGRDQQRKAQDECARLEAAIAVDEAELVRLQVLEQQTCAVATEADTARETLSRIASLLGLPTPDRA
jgi:hypothetical protein